MSHWFSFVVAVTFVTQKVTYLAAQYWRAYLLVMSVILQWDTHNQTDRRDLSFNVMLKWPKFLQGNIICSHPQEFTAVSKHESSVFIW